MDTKMRALEKAQELFMRLLENGKQPCITNVESTSVGKYFCVSPVEIKENSIFEYSDPKPLEKDTKIFDKSIGIYRYAAGELDGDSCNVFYPPGYCSLNINDKAIGWAFLKEYEFEIIEKPDEFERVQTPDEQCIYFGCSKYVNKWKRVESDKFLNGDCDRCRIPIGTPSKLQVKK